MPSESTPQHNFMEGCDHGAGYENCPPKSVAHDFVEADKGKTFRRDGGLHTRHGLTHYPHKRHKS